MKWAITSLLMAFFINSALAQSQKTEKQIVLGSSSALSGPAGKLGTRLNVGAELYFNHINANGGVSEHSIKLLKLDDEYEPTKALRNTYQLLTHKEVFAFFNFVGTPTSAAVLPEIVRNNMLYITPFTGAQFLREESAKGVINLRASYYEEAQEQIDYLINEVGAKRIGLLVQADEFGVSLERGYLKALDKINKKPVVTTRFRRNTIDINLALEILINHDVDAVAFVGTYQPFAELINKGHRKGFKPFYTTVSFVSSSDLFPLLSESSKVLVTEVVPNIRSCDLNVCEEFRELAKQANISDYGPIEFEGYLNAKFLTGLISSCKDDLNKSCIEKKAASTTIDLGGLKTNDDKEQLKKTSKVYRSFNFDFQ